MYQYNKNFSPNIIAINPGTYLWSNPLNWSDNTLPSTGDNIFFLFTLSMTSYTVIFDVISTSSTAYNNVNLTPTLPGVSLTLDLHEPFFTNNLIGNNMIGRTAIIKSAVNQNQTY